MDGLTARIGLIYEDMVQALLVAYERWDVPCSREDIERILRRSGHVRVMVRRELRNGGKREAVYREVGADWLGGLGIAWVDLCAACSDFALRHFLKCLSHEEAEVWAKQWGKRVTTK